MSEQPAARPPARGQGQKYAGLTRNQWLIVGGVFVAALGYILWKRHQAATTASTTASTGTNECTDANGNPVDCGELTAQELAALQNELDTLQASGYGGGTGGGYGYTGGTSSTGTATGTGTITSTGTSTTTAPGASGPVYPLSQTGTVHSATTGRSGAVKTSDGGFTWVYAGVPSTAKEPANQTGTVHSNTTNRNASVKSVNGGKTWTYSGVPSPA